MLISEKHIVPLYQLELLAFAFLLPIYRKVIPYIIAMIVITWFLEGDFVKKLKYLTSSRHRQHILLLSSLYVIYVIGLLYTHNFGYGWFDLEVKMSLIIFPVIFSTIHQEVLTSSLARRVLMAFVLGVTTAMLLCYTVATYKYFSGGTLDVFYYSKLSVFIHPSYLAMYVSFAMAILLYFLIKGKFNGWKMKVLVVLLLIALEIFIVNLSSKAGILGLALVLALVAAYDILIQKRFFHGLAIGGIMGILFVIFLIIFPTSAGRFQQTRQALEQASVNADEISNSSGERIMIWWYSFEITNDHFLYGVGTGDVKDKLLEKYEEKGMTNARELELNAHNQYLQTMITLGAIGLIVLLLNLLLPALYSIDQKHYLYLVFLLLIGFHLLFESMLETQAGVVFYAFFTTYLFAIKKDPAS